MKTVKHTQGPWTVRIYKKIKRGRPYIAVAPVGNDKQWAICYLSRRDDKISLSNARVLASAPDAVELLQRIILNNALKSDSLGRELLKEAKDFVAKVTGGEE